MSEYFLAVDGGGTKTKVLCTDENSNVIGESVVGPTSLTVTSIGAASFNLIEAIRQVVENKPEVTSFKSVVLGLAGVDTPSEQKRADEVFRRALAPYHFEHFWLVNDSEIALANGTDNKNALILVSGTGSICYGKNEQGVSVRVSGMDYLLADQGSAYSMGRKVLTEATKSFDGRGPKTSLEKKLCESFMIATFAEIKGEIYNPDYGKGEIARLAPFCTAAAAEGDAVALKIVAEEIDEMVLSVLTVLQKVYLEGVTFDCVFSGSVLGVEMIAEGVKSKLLAKYPQLNFVSQEKQPVYGALKIAMGLARQ